MKLKHIAAAAALMASGSAFAGVTGNVGAFSEYMFRGLEQENGAAVQGGVDYSHGSGLYAGAWASNAAVGGGSELDVYGGFAGKVSDFSYDVGAIYYYYPEDEESGFTPLNDTTPASPDGVDYYEVYVGGGFGPVSAKVFFTDDFGNTGEDSIYATVSGTFPLSSTVNLIAQIGSSSGDAYKNNGATPNLVGDVNGNVVDDDYIDYSLTLTKTLDAGFVASFALIGSNADYVGGTDDEGIKPVIGLKKTFDL